MQRVLEPELMDDEAQADAYARADFAEVNQSFVDHLVAEFPELENARVVDLGCGPADILVRLADRWPHVEAVGVDGAEAMLASGRQVIADRGLAPRIQLVRSMLPGADVVPGFDAVVSNSLLHHLANPDVLWTEAVRLGKPGAAVVIVDLMRPESKAAAERIVETYAKDEQPVLKIDFYNSLLAAFTPGEVRQQLSNAGLSQLRVEEISDRHLRVQGRLLSSNGGAS